MYTTRLTFLYLFSLAIIISACSPLQYYDLKSSPGGKYWLVSGNDEEIFNYLYDVQHDTFLDYSAYKYRPPLFVSIPECFSPDDKYAVGRDSLYETASWTAAALPACLSSDSSFSDTSPFARFSGAYIYRATSFKLAGHKEFSLAVYDVIKPADLHIIWTSGYISADTAGWLYSFGQNYFYTSDKVNYDNDLQMLSIHITDPLTSTTENFRISARRFDEDHSYYADSMLIGKRLELYFTEYREGQHSYKAENGYILSYDSAGNLFYTFESDACSYYCSDVYRFNPYTRTHELQYKEAIPEGILISSNGKYVCVFSGRNSTAVYSPEQQKNVLVVRDYNHWWGDNPKFLFSAHDTQFVLPSRSGRKIFVWDIASKKIVKTVLLPE